MIHTGKEGLIQAWGDTDKPDERQILLVCATERDVLVVIRVVATILVTR